MSYPLLLFKRRLEDIFIFPFICIGRLISYFRPLTKEYRTFFFFSFYHIGGAEKVHAQIVQATGGKDCLILFTRKSDNNLFREEFIRSGCDIKDISRYTDNKWLYFLNLVYRGIITGYINRQQQLPILFNGQCNFAYKISPWVKKRIKQVELIHSFNSFSAIRLPFLPFFHTTVMISRKRISDHEAQYKKIGVPEHFRDRINYITNAVNLPATVHKKTGDLTVLYAGRGGVEKRVPLIAAIATQVTEKRSDIHFEFMGDVSDVLETGSHPFIRFYGNINSEELIHTIYNKASILLLTSSTEGFPMVVIEAMAHGCVVIATPVGDIPFHIKNGETGFTFSTSDNESAIVEEGVSLLLALKDDPARLERISSAAYNYAKLNFGIDSFNRSYRELLKY